MYEVTVWFKGETPQTNCRFSSNTEHPLILENALVKWEHLNGVYYFNLFDVLYVKVNQQPAAKNENA